MDVIIKVAEWFYFLVLGKLLLIGCVELNPGPKVKDMKIHGLDHEISKALKNRNWKECVKIIMENKPEHDTVYKQLQNVKLQQCLPLVAAEKGYVELIQVLLCNGLNVDEKIQRTGETMLHVAAQCGNNNVVEFLLSNYADIEVRDNDECAPLHSAAYDGHLSTVELLIQKGAVINARNIANWTPLHYAAAAYDGLSTVELLIQKGAVINAKNIANWTPLHYAVLCGDIAVVQCLLDNNCNREIKNKDGNTALDILKRKDNTI